MTNEEIKSVINKIFNAVFAEYCPFTLEEIQNKFAFDIRLPMEVKDSTTGEITYTSNINSNRFITNQNMEAKETKEGWLKPKVPIKNLQELLEIWDSVNYTTTERVYNSTNVSQSDPIYNSNNVFRSTDCGNSNNIIFCDGAHNSSYALACERSDTLNYCLRVSDSNTCTNSYNVICSGKISNSIFIQDCSNLHECIFCSHIANCKYCIANMQFTEEEYFYLKEEIIKWILSK